jgi:hypothetical protein
MSACSENDPRHQARHARQLLQSIVDLLREDGPEIVDPKAQALFETSAEVLEGLVKAFDHYEQKTEKAWQ